MSRLTVPVGREDHIEGPADAPVTLVEYGDYECPYCGEAYPIIKRIQKKMGPSLRFVFRNFPLSESHPHALAAAQAAEAAARQGKFWEMHDTLYENQEAQENPDLINYARGLGLELEKFRHDFSSEPVESKVQEDFNSGLRSGVNGTPTFFVDGERYDGSFDYSELLSALEEQAGSRRQSTGAKRTLHKEMKGR